MDEPPSADSSKTEGLSPSHQIICVFPVLSLLSIGAAVWLPYPQWVHEPIEDRESFQRIASSTTLDYSSFAITETIPRDNNENDNEPIDADYLSKISTSEWQRPDLAILRVRGRPGTTRLELCTFLANTDLHPNRFLDNVVYRLRRRTEFSNGEIDEDISDLTMREWNILHQSSYTKGPSVSSWSSLLESQIWRTDPSTFWQVARRLEHQGFCEPPMRWRYSPAQYLAMLKSKRHITELPEHDCSICRIPMLPPPETGSNGESHRALELVPCEHVFCEECITTWLGMSAICPMCRKELIIPQRLYREDGLDLKHPDLNQERYGFAGIWTHEAAVTATAAYIQHHSANNLLFRIMDEILLPVLRQRLTTGQRWVWDACYNSIYRRFSQKVAEFFARDSDTWHVTSEELKLKENVMNTFIESVHDKDLGVNQFELDLRLATAGTRKIRGNEPRHGLNPLTSNDWGYTDPSFYGEMGNARSETVASLASRLSRRHYTEHVMASRSLPGDNPALMAPW